MPDATPATTFTPEIKLCKETIVTVALELVKEVGLKGLTLRQLADRLGVQNPALYWHFKNKNELISLIKERVVENCFNFKAPKNDWIAWYMAYGKQARKEIIGLNDGSTLLSIGMVTPRIQNEIIPRLWAPLLAAGFSDREAKEASSTILSFILGWAVYEQNERSRNLMAGLINLERAYRNGLKQVLTGIEYSRHKSTPTK